MCSLVCEAETQNRALAPNIVVAGNATITVASPLLRHSFANALKCWVVVNCVILVMN